MRGIIWTLVALIVGAAMVVLLAQPVAAGGAPKITAEELKAKLDDPDVIILDVRRAGHWKASDRKIAGAVREDPLDDVEGWGGNYAHDKTLVLYCG